MNPEFYKLADADEFDRRFIELTAEYSTYEETYKAVEKEHKKAYGHNRYASYDSYRNSRKARRRNKKRGAS